MPALDQEGIVGIVSKDCLEFVISIVISRAGQCERCQVEAHDDAGVVPALCPRISVCVVRAPLARNQHAHDSLQRLDHFVFWTNDVGPGVYDKYGF